jgi:tmRNA-binding protein
MELLREQQEKHVLRWMNVELYFSLKSILRVIIILAEGKRDNEKETMKNLR